MALATIYSISISFTSHNQPVRKKVIDLSWQLSEILTTGPVAGMSPHLFYLIVIAATGSQLDAFKRVGNCQHSRPRLITSELSFTPAKDGLDDPIDTKIEMLQVADASLNVLLENMPIAEKYAVLLQSYATDIIDNTNRTIAALDTMDLLFTEMLSKSIAPSEKASKLLIDASSTFCSSIKLGKSLQLAKAGDFKLNQTRTSHSSNAYITCRFFILIGLNDS